MNERQSEKNDAKPRPEKIYEENEVSVTLREARVMGQYYDIP